MSKSKNKKYELKGAEKLSVEDFYALRDTLFVFTKMKNQVNNPEIWYDHKVHKVFTDNNTTKRLYNLMKDFEE